MLASSADRAESVRLLLEAGADVNLRDKRGDTAWFMASHRKHFEVMSLLIGSRGQLHFQADDGVDAALLMASERMQISAR